MAGANHPGPPKRTLGGKENPVSIFFWRKTKDTSIYRRDGIAQPTDVAVSEDNPLPVRPISNEDDEPIRVQVNGIAPVRDEPLVPLGKQTGLSVAATAVSLTLPSGPQPKRALIQVFTAPIRFWVDGSAPTTTTGHRADYYDTIELKGYNEIVNFLAIRESAASATLEVSFYG